LSGAFILRKYEDKHYCSLFYRKLCYSSIAQCITWNML
jgi:hypothetical protein